MHICFITNNVITKHATMKRAFGLGPALAQRGCKVTIYTEDHPDNQQAAATAHNCTVDYYKPGSPWYEYFQKMHYISTMACDVVHVCGLGWRNAVLPLTRVPILMDHVELESSLKGSTKLRCSLQFLLEWASVFLYKSSITASRFLERLLTSRHKLFGLKRNILTLPYASDVPGQRLSIAKTFPGEKRSNDKQLILYMGGLYENYGCLAVIQALQGLLPLRTDWLTILVGRGPERERIAELILKLGLSSHVQLAGYVSEEQLQEYLAAAAVFLTPLNDTITDWARCPSKTYMYMMYRRPIVTCRVGETYEALKSDGFYYKPGDPKSMTEAINNALDSPSEWNPNYDCSEHTWDARAETYLSWLRNWLSTQHES